MSDEVAKNLRKQLAQMTTRDWLQRVCELQHEVEARDRMLKSRDRRIYELESKVALLEDQLEWREGVIDAYRERLRAMESGEQSAPSEPEGSNEKPR